MKKWTEVKEQIDMLVINGAHPARVAEALQDLTNWLDNYFYGEWRTKLRSSEQDKEAEG